MKLRGEHWAYFARLSWARLDWVTSARPDHYSRIGTPRFDEHEPGFSGG
jgi:hypothetical protein